MLTLAVAMAGCSHMDSLRSYERNTEGASDMFTFNVANGTQQLLIIFSTEGSPASDGRAILIIEREEANGADDDGEEIYFGSLGHGKRDEQLVEDPAPGRYEAIIAFQEYTGPASVDIEAPSGSTAVGPQGVNLGNNFWDILGVVLAVAIATGGWFLYRRHTKRLDREMGRIDETFHRLNNDVGVCRKSLMEMHEQLRHQLVKSKLKEAHFMILEKRIDRYLEDLKQKANGATETPLELE